MKKHMSLVLPVLIITCFFLVSCSMNNNVNNKIQNFLNLNDSCQINNITQCKDIPLENEKQNYILCNGAIYFTSTFGNRYGFYRNCKHINDSPAHITQFDNKYLVDDAVYYNGDVIIYADPRSFKVLKNFGYGDYAVDKNHVFQYTNVIEDANPKYFSILQNRYSMDDKTVYYTQNGLSQSTFTIGSEAIVEYTYPEAIIVQNADPLTFEVFNSSIGMYNYALDKNSAYLNGIKIDESDPKSFLVLCENNITGSSITDNNISCAYSYSKDNNHVYYGTKIIIGADPNTFIKVRGDYYGIDKNNCFALDMMASSHQECVYYRKIYDTGKIYNFIA